MLGSPNMIKSKHFSGDSEIFISKHVSKRLERRGIRTTFNILHVHTGQNSRIVFR